jgi:hypothetical protein
VALSVKTRLTKNQSRGVRSDAGDTKLTDKQNWGEGKLMGTMGQNHIKNEEFVSQDYIRGFSVK